eukprot:scaffold34236_cov62-Isochrysis_galbana.AAC.1
MCARWEGRDRARAAGGGANLRKVLEHLLHILQPRVGGLEAPGLRSPLLGVGKGGGQVLPRLSGEGGERE